mgnify:CR=1 FL=1
MSSCIEKHGDIELEKGSKYNNICIHRYTVHRVWGTTLRYDDHFLTRYQRLEMIRFHII